MLYQNIYKNYYLDSTRKNTFIDVRNNEIYIEL